VDRFHFLSADVRKLPALTTSTSKFLFFCFRVDPTEEGDYEICFDNTFSRITRKTVFFEIILDSSSDSDDLDDDEGEWKKFVAPDETYGDALTSMEVAGVNVGFSCLP